MAYYVRYFAAQPLTTKAIEQTLKQYDPSFKIDLGELIRGETPLGQLEVNQAGGDLFEDDLRHTVHAVEATGQGNAVVPRLRASRATVVVTLDWGDRGTDATLQLVAPLWSALQHLSPGLAQWDGNGIFDGGNRIVDLSAPAR
jgi:hypothetical protein